MFTNQQMRFALFVLAAGAAAWWLLQSRRPMKLPKTAGKKLSNERLMPQSTEYWLDDEIEASFPASDPPSSTPLLGAGRRASL